MLQCATGEKTRDIHLYELLQLLLSNGCVPCDLSEKKKEEKKSNKNAITNNIIFCLCLSCFF